jgi:MFS family permease
MNPGFFVQFHRYCSTVAVFEMSKDYDVELERMSIFSSGYFYSYAIVQPIIGLLADVVEVRKLICGGLIGSAVGSILTSFSTSLPIGVIGRILVGVSCSPLYLSAQKVSAIWFESQYFGLLNGLWNFISGLGVMAAQYPLSMPILIIGWRWCFRNIAIMSACLSCLCSRLPSSPEALGFPATPGSTAASRADQTKGQTGFFENMKVVLKNFRSWIAAIYILYVFLPFHTLSGLWAAPYVSMWSALATTQLDW